MSAEVLVFDLLAVLAVLGALGVIVFRNPVHSAVSFVVMAINVAGAFVVLRAEFLAAIQVIVYTGAILVLVLFVIMLVDPEDMPDFHEGRQPLQRVFGFILGLVLLSQVAAAVLTRTVVGQPGPWSQDFVDQHGGNVQVLGQFLYSGFVLPIQSVAIILLIGTIGALVLARPDRPPTARRRAVGTISLGHSRGSSGELNPALPAGAAAAMRNKTVQYRDGIVIVQDNESFTERPAWDLQFGEPATDRKYADDGFGIGREGQQS